MDLKDLDRKTESVRYEPWQCDVVLRPIGAVELVRLNGSHPGVDGKEATAAGLAKFYADLLAASVVSHPATAEEWLECRMETLSELGMHALRVSGLIAAEAKKN